MPRRLLWFPLAAGGVSVDTGVGALTITGLAPTVTTQLKTNVGLGALTLTGNSTTVNVVAGDKTTNTGLGALTLTGFVPGITEQLVTQVGTAALSVTGYAPTITTGLQTDVDVGSLTITGYAPTATTQVVTDTGVGSLTLTGYSTDISVVTPGTAATEVGSLTLTGLAPTVTSQIVVNVGLGALTITGYAPTISTGVNTSTGASSLIITGLAPTIKLNHVINVGTGALTLTGYDTTIGISGSATVNTGLGQLVITGYPPTIKGPSRGGGAAKRKKVRKQLKLEKINLEDLYYYAKEAGVEDEATTELLRVEEDTHADLYDYWHAVTEVRASLAMQEALAKVDAKQKQLKARIRKAKREAERLNELIQRIDEEEVLYLLTEDDEMSQLKKDAVQMKINLKRLLDDYIN